MTRSAEIKRTTKETDISLTLNLDGTGKNTIDTGIGFFDHMLTLFAVHAKVDLTCIVRGDLEVDGHHTVEDVGIALGEALNQALGDRRGIVRYAAELIPMDEALLRCVLDFSGRPFLVFDAALTSDRVGSFETQLTEEFFRAVAMKSLTTLHLACLYGKNDHHIIEGLFKAFARAVRSAKRIDPEFANEIPSSKGLLV